MTTGSEAMESCPRGTEESGQPPAFAYPAFEDAFRRDGVVVSELLDETGVAALVEGHDRLGVIEARGAFTASTLYPSPRYRRAVDAAVRSVVQARLKRLLPGYRMVFGAYACKLPGPTNRAFPLHQDFTCTDEASAPAIGFWCPLVEVGTGNGGLELVLGSHHVGTAARGALTGFRYADHVAELRRHYLSTAPLGAGEVVLQDLRVFHGSPPNQSGARRLVAAGILVPEGASLLYTHAADLDDHERLERFEVHDDRFYLEHELGQRPAVSAGRSLGAEHAPRAPFTTGPLQPGRTVRASRWPW